MVYRSHAYAGNIDVVAVPANFPICHAPDLLDGRLWSLGKFLFLT